MMRKAESESKGPGEFIVFALELLPEELFLVSVVIGVVFGLLLITKALKTQVHLSPRMAEGPPRRAAQSRT